ncbi:hypothetical protein [Thermostichus sp. MS-CIW-37]
MLRCPDCSWLNPDSDYRCRRCGHFLRHRPLPVAGKGSQLNPRRPNTNPADWREIRWDRVLTSSAILGVLVGLGQLSWHWVQLLLRDPPLPSVGNGPAASGR